MTLLCCYTSHRHGSCGCLMNIHQHLCVQRKVKPEYNWKWGTRHMNWLNDCDRYSSVSNMMVKLEIPLLFLVVKLADFHKAREGSLAVPLRKLLYPAPSSHSSYQFSHPKTVSTALFFTTNNQRSEPTTQPENKIAHFESGGSFAIRRNWSKFSFKFLTSQMPVN